MSVFSRFLLVLFIPLFLSSGATASPKWEEKSLRATLENPSLPPQDRRFAAEELSKILKEKVLNTEMPLADRLMAYRTLLDLNQNWVENTAFQTAPVLTMALKENTFLDSRNLLLVKRTLQEAQRILETQNWSRPQSELPFLIAKLRPSAFDEFVDLEKAAYQRHLIPKLESDLSSVNPAAALQLFMERLGRDHLAELVLNIGEIIKREGIWYRIIDFTRNLHLNPDEFLNLTDQKISDLVDLIEFSVRSKNSNFDQIFDLSIWVLMKAAPHCQLSQRSFEKLTPLLSTGADYYLPNLKELLEFFLRRQSFIPATFTVRAILEDQLRKEERSLLLRFRRALTQKDRRPCLQRLLDIVQTLD
jgi:hypothetical protein